MGHQNKKIFAGVTTGNAGTFRELCQIPQSEGSCDIGHNFYLPYCFVNLARSENKSVIVFIL